MSCQPVNRNARPVNVRANVPASPFWSDGQRVWVGAIIDYAEQWVERGEYERVEIHVDAPDAPGQGFFADVVGYIGDHADFHAYRVDPVGNATLL